MASIKDQPLVDFARGLNKNGFTLYGSAGTAKYLAGFQVDVIDIATLVGDPLLGHRVVSIDRKLAAGVLAKDTPADHADLEKHGAIWLDLVYVSLYDTQAAIDAGKSFDEVIELIDVGGPTFLNASAKGRRIVVSSPVHFDDVLSFIEGNLPEGVSQESFLEALAIEAHCTVIRHYEQAVDYRISQLNQAGEPMAIALVATWDSKRHPDSDLVVRVH